MTQSWYGSPQPIDWQAWFERFRQLEQQLQQLQQAVGQIDAMQKDIAELKNKAPVHVEYHFDQLKVSRLEGTLNIGLTPQGVQDMEQFDVSGASHWSPPFAPVPGTVPGAVPADLADQRIRGLQAEAAGEVDRDLPVSLQQLAGQLQIPINEPHLRAIINDIKKQLNQRVHYYARTTPYPEQGSEEEQANWNRSVLERTKRDVETAIAQYLRSLTEPRAEGGKEKS